tara:strand:+ start:552 stop:9542 length:8991 start_codon:yes stop_codon:yes gene_type:complete
LNYNVNVRIQNYTIDGSSPSTSDEIQVEFLTSGVTSSDYYSATPNPPGTGGETKTINHSTFISEGNPTDIVWDKLGTPPLAEDHTFIEMAGPTYLWMACAGGTQVSGNTIVDIRLIHNGQTLNIDSDDLVTEILCPGAATDATVLISNPTFIGYEPPVAACGNSCASNYDPDADLVDPSECNYNNPAIYFPQGLCVEDSNVINQNTCEITYSGYNNRTTIDEPDSGTTTSKFLAFDTSPWVNLENADFTNGITYELTQGSGAPSNAYFAINNGTSYTTSDYTEVIEVVFTSSDDVYENENIAVEWSITYTHCQTPSDNSLIEFELPRTGAQWFTIVNDDVQIFGCTDELAINYNSDATNDNNSCLYMTIEASTTTPNSGETVTFTITGTGTQSGFFEDVSQMGSFPGDVAGLEILVDYTDNNSTDDTISSLPSGPNYTTTLTSNNYILAQQYTAVFTITNGTFSFDYEINIQPPNVAPVADILESQGGSSHPASSDPDNPTPVFGNTAMPNFWAGFTDPTGLTPYEYKWKLVNTSQYNAVIETNDYTADNEAYPVNGFIPEDHTVFDSYFFYNDVIEVRLQVKEGADGLESNTASRYFQIIEYTAGCMDSDACNYDASATVDNGSCNYGPTTTFYGYVDEDDDDFYEVEYEVSPSDSCTGDDGANDVALGTWAAGRRCYCDFNELEDESGILNLVNSATGPEVYGCLPGDTIGPSGDEQATNYNYNFDGETVTEHQNKYCISLDALYAFKSNTSLHLPDGYYDFTDELSPGGANPESWIFYTPVSGDNIKIRIYLDEIWKNDTDWSEWGNFGEQTQLVIDYNYQDGNDVGDAHETIWLNSPLYDSVYDNPNHLQSSNGNIANGINYDLAGTYTIRTYISQPGTIFYHKDFTFTIENQAPSDVEIIDESDAAYDDGITHEYLHNGQIYLNGSFTDPTSATHTYLWEMTNQDGFNVFPGGSSNDVLDLGFVNIDNLGEVGDTISIKFTVTDSEGESNSETIYLFIGSIGCMTEPADSCDNYPTFSYCPIITNYDPNAIVDSNQCIYAFITAMPDADQLNIGENGIIIINGFDYDDDWVSPDIPFYFNVIWGDGNQQAYEFTDSGTILAQNTYTSVVTSDLIIQIIDNNGEVYYELIRPLNVAEQPPEIVDIQQCVAEGDYPCDEGNPNFNSGAVSSDTHTFEVGEEINLRFYVQDYSEEITIDVEGEGVKGGDGAFLDVEYLAASPTNGVLIQNYIHNPFIMPDDTITITMTADDGTYEEIDEITLQPKVSGCMVSDAINYDCNAGNASSTTPCEDNVTEDDGSCVFYPNVTLILTPGSGGSAPPPVGIGFSNDWEGFEVDVKIDYNLSTEATDAGYSYSTVTNLEISTFNFSHNGETIDFLYAPGIDLSGNINEDITDDNIWSLATTFADLPYGIPVGPSVALFSNFKYETLFYTYNPDEESEIQLYEFPGVSEYLDPGEYEVEIEISTTDSSGNTIPETLYYLNTTRLYYVCDDDDADNYFGLYDRDSDGVNDTTLCTDNVCIAHGQCSYVGCTDADACNYDPTANINYGCTYPETGYGCDCDNISDLNLYYTDNDNDGYGCGDDELAATQSCVDLTELDSPDCNGTGTAVTNKFYCETDSGTFYETAAACHVDTMCTADGPQCTDTGMLSNCWTLNNDGTDTGYNCDCASNVICDLGCCSNADAICYVPTEYEESLYELGLSSTICCEVGYLDECGVCGGDNNFTTTGLPGPNQDCAGTCGGELELDDCGVCGGPGPTEVCCDDSIICVSETCPTCGCMDPLAANYNPEATVELLDVFGYSECQYTACFDGIFDENGNLTAAGETHPDGLTIDPENIDYNPLSVYDWEAFEGPTPVFETNTSYNTHLYGIIKAYTGLCEAANTTLAIYLCNNPLPHPDGIVTNFNGQQFWGANTSGDSAVSWEQFCNPEIGNSINLQFALSTDCNSPGQRVFTWTDDIDPTIDTTIPPGAAGETLDEWYGDPNMIPGTCTITCISDYVAYNNSGKPIYYPDDGGTLAGPANGIIPEYPTYENITSGTWINSTNDNLGHQCVYFGCSEELIDGYPSTNYNSDNYNCGSESTLPYSSSDCCDIGENKLEITPAASFGLSNDTYQFKAFNGTNTNNESFVWVVDGTTHEYYSLQIFECIDNSSECLTLSTDPIHQWGGDCTGYPELEPCNSDNNEDFVRRTAYNNETWSTGFQYKFQNAGYFKIILKSSNTPEHDSGIMYQIEQIFEVEDFIKIYPSIGYFDENTIPYLPYQGIDLNQIQTIETIDYDYIDIPDKNTEGSINNFDLDLRPKLGVFYPDEIQYADWSEYGFSGILELPAGTGLSQPSIGWVQKYYNEETPPTYEEPSNCQEICESFGKTCFDTYDCSPISYGSGTFINGHSINHPAGGAGGSGNHLTTNTNSNKSACNYPIPDEDAIFDIGDVMCCCGAENFDGEWQLNFNDNYTATFFWIPDADVRTISSLNSNSKPGLFYYWDKELHPEQYEFTTAPTQVQFYFYPRYTTTSEDIKTLNPFEERDILEDYGENWYVSNIDWGDGNVDLEAQRLNLNKVIYHHYTNPGIYTITGDMHYGSKNEIISIIGSEILSAVKKFKIVINLNESDKFNDFTYLGSDGYKFIPYKKTTPIIGGISSNSIYENIIKRQLGFINNITSNFNTPFKNYYDKLSTENALAVIDENNILSALDIFTKSYFDNSVSNALPGTDNYGSSFEENGTPEEIFKPKFNHFGELGNHLNYTDIAQIRYFNEPKSMWEMLGFTDNASGNPSNEKYWKNIVPQNFDVLTDYMDNEQYLFDIIASYSKILGAYDATQLQVFLVNYGLCDEQTSVPFDGCSTEIQTIVDEVSTLNLSEYVVTDINDDGNINVTDVISMINIYIQQQTYYYPVLPNVNQYGRFDESLGLRNNNTPFGSERNWNQDDTEAPITNENYRDDSLLIDIKMDLLEQDVLEDNSGNKNVGMMISDYRIEFDNQTLEPTKGQTTKSMKIETTNRKAF